MAVVVVVVVVVVESLTRRPARPPARLRLVAPVPLAVEEMKGTARRMERAERSFIEGYCISVQNEVGLKNSTSRKSER